VEQAQNCNVKIIEQPRRNRGAAAERTLPAGQVLLGRLGIVNGRLQTQGNVSCLKQMRSRASPDPTLIDYSDLLSPDL